MNRRQKIIVSVVGIFIVLLALIGLMYAYFLIRITVDSFYESKLTSYKSYLADSAFCQGEARLSYTTLKCNNPALNFTSETNNVNGVKTSAILKYPIGLI